MSLILHTGSRSRASLSDLPTYRSRARRSYSDSRYGGSSDLSSFIPTYSDTLPPYSSRGNYGYGYTSGSARDVYSSYPGLSTGLYRDSDSMSRYTRSYDRNSDTSPRSYDTTTRSYDTSTRLRDKGPRTSPDSDVATDLGRVEFGTRYGGGRSSDSSPRNYDVSTRKNDTSTRTGDVTPRTTARTSSLSDREWLRAPSEEEDESSETAFRRPFLRRVNSADSQSSHSSGKSETRVDDSHSPFSAYKNRYQETLESPDDAKSSVSSWRRSGHFEEDTSKHGPVKQAHAEKSADHVTRSTDRARGLHTGDGSRESTSPAANGARHVSPSPDSGSKETSADDLIFNFRKALRRHALSEDKKTAERSKDSSDVMEKIRIAKAHMKEAAKPLSSPRSETRYERKSISPEKVDVKTEPEQPKFSHKLARQKLVSDDLKAKYIENKQDRGKQEDTVDYDRSTQRLHSRQKRDENMTDLLGLKTEGINGADIKTARSGKDTGEVKSSRHSGSHVIKDRPSSDSSVKDAFASVYGKSAVDEEKHERKSPRNFKKYTKSKSLELGQLSQNAEVKVEAPPEPVSQDDSKVGAGLTMDELSQMTRKERIAKYKEERKKQLATISARFGKEGTEYPSLFLSSKESGGSESPPLARSRSLRQESDRKAEHSPQVVLRSKSLKTEPADKTHDSPGQKAPAMTGLRLAELGSQQVEEGKTETHYNTDNIIDRLQALRKLRAEHMKHEGTSLEELQSKRLSKDMDVSEKTQKQSEPEPKGPLVKSTLLADREYDKSKKETERKPTSKDSHSGKTLAESLRVKRQLPSLEDVMGTSSPSPPSPSAGRSDTTDAKPVVFDYRKKHFEGDKSSSSTKSSDTSGLSKSVQKEKPDSNKIKTRQKVPDSSVLIADSAKEYKPTQFNATKTTITSPVQTETSQKTSSPSSKHPSPSTTSGQARKPSSSVAKPKTPTVSPALQDLIKRDDAEAERERTRQMMLGLQPSTEAAATRPGPDSSKKSPTDAESQRLTKPAAEGTRIPSPKSKRKEEKESKESKPPSSPRSEKKHAGKGLHKPKEKDYSGQSLLFGFPTDQEKKEKKDWRHLVQESEKHEGKLQSGGAEGRSQEATKVATKISYRDREREQQDQKDSIAPVKDEVTRHKSKSPTSKSPGKEPKSPGKESKSPTVKLKKEEHKDTKTSHPPKDTQPSSQTKDTKSVKPIKISYRDQEKLKKEKEEGKAASKLAEAIPFRTDYVDQKDAADVVQSKSSVSLTPKSTGQEEEKIKIKTISLKDGKPAGKVEHGVVADRPKPSDTRAVGSDKVDLKSATVTTALGQRVEVPPSPTKPQAPIMFTASSKVKPPESPTPAKESVPPLSPVLVAPQPKTVAPPSKTVIYPKKEPVPPPSPTVIAPRKEPVPPPSPSVIAPKKEQVPPPSPTVIAPKKEPVPPPSPTVIYPKKEPVPLPSPIVIAPKKEPVPPPSPTVIAPKKEPVPPPSPVVIAPKKEPVPPPSPTVIAPKKEPVPPPSPTVIAPRKEPVPPPSPTVIAPKKEPVPPPSPTVTLPKKEPVAQPSPASKEKVKVKEESEKKETKHLPGAAAVPGKGAATTKEKQKPKKSPETKTEKKTGLQLLDTSLDDILSKNVEYLSDLEPPEFSHGRPGAKVTKRPVSMHEQSKPKRTFRKKHVQRSKSEDRLHFKGKYSDSDEDTEVRRSKGTEDIKSKVRGSQSASAVRSLEIRTEALPGGSPTGQEKTTVDGEKKETRSVTQSVLERKKEILQRDSASVKSQGSPVSVSSTVAKGSPAVTSVVHDDRTKTEQVTQSHGLSGSKVSAAPVGSEQVSLEKQSEMVVGDAVKLQQVNEPVELSGQISDIPSGMASDASERSERRRFITRQADSESSRFNTDSDQSVSSMVSDSSRKRRKDKSSLRKSKLNESSEDVSSPRRRDSAGEAPRSTRIIRRVSASRSRESTEADGKAVEEERISRKRSRETSAILTAHDTNKTSSVDKPSEKSVTDATSHQRNKSPVNSDHSGSHRRGIHLSVLDSKSVLPSKFTFTPQPSKVSSAISKLSEASDKNRESPSKPGEEDVSKSPKRIPRGSKFTDLLQKFSSSDASGSEKSDSESQATRKKFLLKRQEACAVSSGSSDDTRRTPERTQSLRLQGTQPPAAIKDTSSVQRSSSFKSDFMKRRFSPEPEVRRKLPATPQQSHPSPQSDQPSPELADLLNKRSAIIKHQQERGEALERERMYDGAVEKADSFTTAGVEEVIADSEVLRMLKSRRKETDSSVEQKTVSHPEKAEAASPSKPEEVKDKPVFKTQTSVTSTTEISLKAATASDRLPASDTAKQTAQGAIKTGGKVSQPATGPSTQQTKVKAVPPLQMSSIDTSLAVLETVTSDLDSHEPESHVEEEKLAQALTEMNLNSPTEVVQFIKNVETEKVGVKVNSSLQEDKVSVDIVKPEKEQPEKSKSIKTVKKQEPGRMGPSLSQEGELEVLRSRTSPEKESRSAESLKREGSPVALDRAKKSDIIKKLHRDLTPERQAPKKAGPLKVMSPAQSSTGLALTRTESVGRSESERPKGILKRTPSLHKAGVIVDPELANILRSRRARHDDVEEEEETKGKTMASEEIRQTREAESGVTEDGVEERPSSVAELVFHMQTKIEEVKSAPITPWARSGGGTPSSAKQRSGDITPKGQSSGFDDANRLVSGPQLIERLTSLEDQQKGGVSEKRRRFQQRRQEDWRARTQPVTQVEVQQADSLETVRKFRADILKKASINVYESLQKPEKSPVGKKTEYPQHIRPEKRTRGQRHKTLPVTAAELSALPEDNVLSGMDTLRKRFDSEARDSKADSGILSGSDGENLERDSDRSASMDETLPEDDPVKMSVSAKASLFKQIEEKLKEKPEKKCASGAKRYIDRKKRERSRTQPITEEEVKTAAEIADNEVAEQTKTEAVKAETESGDKPPEQGPEATAETDDNHDDLSRRSTQLSASARQSLADKVSLFTNIAEAEKKAPKKAVPPPPRRKNRKLASRFATQPVTYEEVEKAAKISPLALSLVKPPDPELLQGLPVKAQRELMAQHAQQCLSQPGSRSASVTDLRAEGKGSVKAKDDSDVKRILKEPVKDLDTDGKKSILKPGAETSDPSEGRPPSIVRSHDFLLELDQKVGKGILKPNENKSNNALTRDEPKSILKHEESANAAGDIETDTEPRSILKSPHASDLMDQLKGVLKGDPQGVLKKDSSGEQRGILKKDSSFETKKTEPDKSVLRRPSKELGEGPVKGILKSSGAGEPQDVDSVTPAQRSPSPAPGPQSGQEETEDTPTTRTDRGRRRFNRDSKAESERYRTQPAEITADSGSPESSARRKVKYTGRHMTQPITPDEKREAETATEMPEIKASGSIHDRLNALKKSGEEEWRKRVSKNLERGSLSPPDTPVVTVKMREKKGSDLPRPSSIADRLSRLDNAQEGWKGRVEETDVKQFTVAHKIASSGQGLGESPLVARLKKTPRKELITKDSDSSDTDLVSPSTPTRESSKLPLPKEVICTDIPVEPEETGVTPAKPSPLAVQEEVKSPTNVEVPKMDEELGMFFNTTELMEVTEEAGMDVTVDDFNDLFISSNAILETTRKIKPKRRHTAKSRNPLKTMSLNLEVKSEYTEIVTGVAERELKRVKTSQISQGSGFAVEALAGLASKENFSKVELRKTDSNGASTPGGALRYDPYLPLMLIHIKGRRRVQCRLVEPTASSINSGDCFLLVTPDKIIMWLGEYCNVIEKAKAADVAEFVKQKRDLGCKNALAVATVEEKTGRRGAGRQFWELIGGHKDYMAGGPPEEDELYENHVVETNMVYRLEKNKLVPMEEFWGTQPTYKMLTKDEVFVFDFGSELYLWQGKSVSPTSRKVALRLAQQLWEGGYDYSSCDINPICPLRSEEHGGLPTKAPERPSWALFGKVNQNMETILFREKFSDWPDTSRLIMVKSQEDVSGAKMEVADLKPYDAKLMVPVNTSPISMVLEGSHVGRGNQWEEDMEGFIRVQNIVTLKVMVWHVLEYDHYQVEELSYGQFHEGDTYVVRWQYMITTAGAKNLKGQASKRTQLGRERCAYFFWQGKSSTINEKGASALMTVELDEERGPQIRVAEGKEPPCFLNLFDGRMIIHVGKREDEATCTQGDWRVYCLRNEYENEMCLIEVPVEISSLRSVSSFLILNVRTGALTVWHGCKSPEHTRKLATAAADRLKDKCPLEVGLEDNVTVTISEVEEGKEATSFWRTMDVHIRDRSQYCSLLHNPESFTHTLRLFHMTSVSGVFEVQEILNPSRAPDLRTPFPVLQTDFYKASQPGLFLVDNGHEVYLWQGWWPEGDQEEQNVLTGSAMTRFTADRRCAMETTLHYCREINPENPPPAYVVYAGLEPLQFTNLFPLWTVDSSVQEINQKDGKTAGEMVLVQDLLQKVSKTRYTFAELEERPLPEGVDPLKLESYLSDEEFEEILEMNKEEFYALPAWKQCKLKQQVGLF